MKTFLTLLLLVLGAMGAPAQPLVTETLLSGTGGLDGNKVTGMTEDDSGFLWVSTWGGLYRFDGYEMRAFRPRPGDGNDLDNARLDDVQNYKHGKLICQSYDAVYEFDPATARFTAVQGMTNLSTTRRNYGNTSEFKRDGYRLKIVNGQLLCYNDDTRRFELLRDSLMLSFVDRQGIVWAGLKDDHFGRIVVSRPSYTMLDRGTNILTLYTDANGRIWQGNNDGTVAVKDSTGHALGYLQPNGSIGAAPAQMGRVYCMAADRQGNLYLGTRGNGLLRLHPQGTGFALTHFVNEKGNRRSLPDNSVYSLLCDAQGRMWAGTYEGGLCVLQHDAAGDYFIHRSNGCPAFPPCDRSHCVRSMAQAGHVVILGSGAGIYTIDSRQDPRRATLHHTARDKNDATSLGSSEIIHVAWYPGYGLVACCSFGGVSLCNDKNLLHEGLDFITWNKENQAPSDQAYRSFLDTAGSLWVVFRNALVRYDADKHSFSGFPAKNNETRHLSGAACTTPGTIWLGTTVGLVKRPMPALEQNPRPLPIVVTTLRSHDQAVDYNPAGDTLTLEKHQRDITLTFAALALDDNEFVEYAYRLDGDTAWINLGNNHTINFYDLKAGDHTLRLRSTNNHGEWLDNERSVVIHVKPTFWETPWAWLIYGLLALLAAAVVVGIILYVYRLRMNMDFEKRMTDVKLKYFTDISHDLRTPLTLIEGPVNEMLHDESLNEQNRNYLTLVHNNARRMLTLVNQILDFRKIQSHKLHLFVERIDLREEISQVMSDFEYMANEQHITLALDDRTAQGAMVWGDRDKLQKVFFNLLSNAFKYTPGGRSIRITLDDGPQATLRAAVADEGKGIEQGAINRIFQRFETILADNYMQSSTGIGLSLVKELVQLHHGTLEVASEEGRGSTFTVVLQKGNDHFKTDDNAELITGSERRQTVESLAESAEDHTEAPSADGRTTLLIVEDDAEMLQFVADILSRHYTVATAADGADGLAKAAEVNPDLIVSDINMPRMNGWELTEALKKDSATSHIPVVLLTANSTVDDRIRGAQLGVEDYIVKPFNTEYLLSRLQAILNNRARLQSHFVEQLSGGAHQATALKLPADNAAVQLRVEQEDQRFMERLRDFMEENLSQNLPIQDLAEHACMSRTLFYHKVKSLTGMTPLDFYRKYHIERAAQMLRGEGQTVAEACYNTGFTDPKYFSRVFKQFMGMSPSDYRNSSDTAGEE